MAQTKVIFKFRELSKGVELNSLSKHVNLIYHIFLFNGISDNWVK